MCMPPLVHVRTLFFFLSFSLSLFPSLPLLVSSLSSLIFSLSLSSLCLCLSLSVFLCLSPCDVALVFFFFGLFCVCWERAERTLYVRNALRVSIQNVSVYACNTRTRVSTSARGAGTHGNTTHATTTTTHTTTPHTTRHIEAKRKEEERSREKVKEKKEKKEKKEEKEKINRSEKYQEIKRK